MIVALLVTVAGSAALVWVSWLGFTGRLPRNGWAGIRVPYSMSSDERWKLTHRAAGPYMVFAGVAALAAGLAFLPFAAAGAISDSVITVLVVAQAIIIGLGVLLGSILGLRKAKRWERDGGEPLT